jgi:hypothetical protein
VATVAAAYTRSPSIYADLYTYGAPRVGNIDFAKFVTSQAGLEFRITHGSDPVPRLPPISFNYRHVSPEYWLTGLVPTKTDYVVSEIKVCPGYASLGCNAGSLLVDVVAHVFYLTRIAGCFAIGILDSIVVREDNPTDTDLVRIVQQFTEMDIEFVKNLEASGEE